MRKTSLPLRYIWLTFRRDQLWFPLAIWALFAIVCLLFRDNKGPDAAAGFLGVVLPLISAILAAYVLLDDPALEITFATAFPAGRLLLVRLGVLACIDLLTALTFQGFCALVGLDLSAYGSFLQLQLLWLIPCLVMSTFGSLVAFLAAQPTAGAMLTGLLWIAQLILHTWFETKPAAHYFFTLSGFFGAGTHWLALSQASLAVLTLLFLGISLRLIRRPERYIAVR